MIGTTTALTGLPTPVMAQESTEVVQEAVVEENKTEQVPVEQETENVEVQENTTDKEQEEITPDKEPAENAETSKEDLTEESAKQETPATPEKEVVTEDKTVVENKNTEVKAGSVTIDEAHFPDKVFREQFIAKFDKDGDYVLSANEISEAKDLDLHDMTTISSLEGIQYLTNLQFLSVVRSSISDLSPVTNSSLKQLGCAFSKVTKVDLARYPELEVLTCNDTSISSLDVSKNKKLYMLFAYNTPISKLDVTNNPNLKQLSCNKTGLTELDVTHNPQLATLDIGDTKIKTLDVSKNPLLHTLVCYHTEINTLNVRNNLDLKELSCFDTNITELDVTKNTKLTRLNCSSTPIKELDLSNNLELERLSCGGVLEQGIRGLDISKNTKIKELACYDLYWLNVGDNTVLENYHNFVGSGYIDIKGNKIDLRKDVEQGIDISKVKVTANGTLDKDTGIITVDNVKNVVTYEYDCGTYKDGNVVLKVELWLNSKEEANAAPTISANDVTLNVGDTFDPLANVTAMDKEDGTIILTKDNIIANDVDTSKTGTYHVTYKVTDKNGASTEKTITVIVKQNTGDLNSAPTISANDVTLSVGDTFDPLANVTATDKEDGTIILTKDNIIANDVDTSKAGTYHVTYKVTDKNGASTEKTIIVIVKQNTGDLNSAPTISAKDVTLNIGNTFDPLANVTATDKEDGIITLTKDNIIANDVDTSKAGTYHVTYKVTDKNGASTEKTITVTVKEKTTNKPISPQQPQKPNKPTTSTKPSGQKNPVKTGDVTNVGLFASMFAGSTGVLAVLFGKKRKRNKND